MKGIKIKTVMITGANAGIGKELASQLALNPEIETIYLACRNELKALAAKMDLEVRTKRAIFEILVMDVSQTSSVRSTLEQFNEPIDALVMNAGGIGGPAPMNLTGDGVTELFAQNVFGHAVLLESLLKKGQLTQTALFVGSEGARGVPKMGIKRPTATSVGDFSEILTGKVYKGKKLDIFSAYGATKYIGALWMASLARKYPDVRLVTVSPGGTKGTEGPKSLPAAMRFFYNYVFTPVLAPMMGLVHPLEVGAKRLSSGLIDEMLKTGHFYGSRAEVLTGDLVDQREIFANFGNEIIQDNAAEAVHRFMA